MSIFKVGQKVKIVQGGWGIHPKFVGQVVTIHSIIFGSQPEDTRYTTEETLAHPELRVPHVAKATSANGKSFEAVPESQLSTADQIRAINGRIRIKDDSIELKKAAIAIDETHKARLNQERQVLVAKLLRELDV